MLGLLRTGLARREGFEPPWPKPPDFKSGALPSYAISATVYRGPAHSYEYVNHEGSRLRLTTPHLTLLTIGKHGFIFHTESHLAMHGQTHSARSSPVRDNAERMHRHHSSRLGR